MKKFIFNIITFALMIIFSIMTFVLSLWYSTYYLQVVSDPSLQQQYIENVLSYIRIYIGLTIFAALMLVMSAIALFLCIKSRPSYELSKQRLVEKSEAKKQQKIAELKKQLEELEKDDQ